ENPIQVIAISPAWQKRQKLEDHIILQLSEIAIELEKKLNIPLELEFGIETGSIYITDLKTLDIAPIGAPGSQDDEVAMAELFNQDDIRTPSTKQEVDLKKIEKEIKTMLKNDSARIKKANEEAKPLLENN